MGKPSSHQPALVSESLLRFRPALTSYFRRRAHPSDVEDLIQDVFLNIQARQAGAPIENMEGYVFAVAMSTLIRRQRRNAGMRQLPDDYLERALGAEELSPERIL